MLKPNGAAMILNDKPITAHTVRLRLSSGVYPSRARSSSTLVKRSPALSEESSGMVDTAGLPVSRYLLSSPRAALLSLAIVPDIVAGLDQV